MNFKLSKINNPLLILLIITSVLIIVLFIIKLTATNIFDINTNKKNIEYEIDQYFTNKLESFYTYINSLKIGKGNKTFIDKFELGKLPANISVEVLNKNGKLIYWNNINDSYAKLIINKFNHSKNLIVIDDNLYKFVVKNTTINDTSNIIYVFYTSVDKLSKDSVILDLSNYLSYKFNNNILAKVKFENVKDPLYFNNQISIYIDKSENYYKNGNNINWVNNLFNTFLLIWVILLYLYVYIYINKKNKNALTLFLVFIISTFFRYLIYYFNLLDLIIFKSFTNPVNYSSTIAYGILKSPIDLTITLFFVINIIYSITKYEFKSSNKPIYSAIKILASSIFIAYISYLSIRIIKSFFYDSNLKYFKVVNFDYKPVTYLMLFNGLIIGVLFVFVLIILFNIINNNFNKNRFTKWFINILFSAIIFFITNLFIKNKIEFGFVLIPIYIIIFGYLIENKDLLLFNLKTYLLGFTLGALFINFSMGIIYTNTERDNLKLAYLELTRIDENVVKFLIKESLFKAQIYFNKIEFNENTDYKKEAFKIWNEGKIKSENLITEYYILDKEKKYLGGVNFSFPYLYSKIWDKYKQYNKIEMVTDTTKDGGLIISGITPINNNNYYFVISVYFNKYGYNFADIPKIIKSNPNNILFDDYIVFWLDGDKIINKKTDIDIYKEDLINIVKNAELNDGFIYQTISSQRFLFYAVKEKQNNRFILIGYKSRDFAWNIYDFVKILIIHFIFIVLFVVIFFIIRFFQKGVPVFNYQAKLLSGFLIITIIPLLILAFYFDETINNKLENTIRFNLMTKSFQTANFLEKYSENKAISIRDLIIKTNADLGINFSLYQNNEVKYSTYLDYYYLGNLSFYIDYNIYKDIYFNNINEVFGFKTIGKSKVYSYYKKVNIFGRPYILEVNDAVNKFYMVFDTSEINLFLYGTYSFAIIVIILMSIILSRRISKPILSLTKAAVEVANGNFDLHIKIKNKGEIGNLTNSFNFMVKELKRIKEELSAREREAAWREMAKQVAHEIKNPLTPIKLSIQLLIQAYKDKSEKFDEIFFKVTQTVSNQIETLRKIADEFSVVAKLPPLTIKLTDVNELVNEIAKLYSNDLIKIKINFNKKNIYVNLDSEQFKRVLINLIKNSIEAEGTELLIDINDLEEFVLIRLEDNGIGIEENYKDKIFSDKFTTKSYGSGIGLTIVKNILHSLNSEIVLLESKRGKTVFEIKIKR